VINTALHGGVSFEEAWEMASTRAAGLVGLGPLPEVSVTVGPAGCTMMR
jgi:hypothetical protein